MKRIKYRSKTKNIIITVITLGVIFTLTGLIIVANTQDNISGIVYDKGTARNNVSVNQPNTNRIDSRIATLDASTPSNSTQTTKSLEYILEEEKLAHDVYQAMYEKWGSRVFSNIINSETSHQNQVSAVMQNRGIADPRSAKEGVFSNPDLQALYDKLIAQGSQNVTEAFKVGVAIEELDISDLKVAIAKLESEDIDIKTTYESLLSGSQNHLSAFNRQLTR